MQKTIDPLEVQFHLVHDCIRACVYADYIGRLKPKATAWLSIADMLYGDAVMSWNAIFGTTSQETHWKKLAVQLVIPPGANLKPFGRGMIVEYLKTTEKEWAAFHASMIDFRNTRLAHFNHSVIREDFPHLTWVLHSSYLYREWLLSLLHARKNAGEKLTITDTTGTKMLELFKEQIAEICKDDGLMQK
jgi:hypothetical protein